MKLNFKSLNSRKPKSPPTQRKTKNNKREKENPRYDDTHIVHTSSIVISLVDLPGIHKGNPYQVIGLVILDSDDNEDTDATAPRTKILILDNGRKYNSKYFKLPNFNIKRDVKVVTRDFWKEGVGKVTTLCRRANRCRVLYPSGFDHWYDIEHVRIYDSRVSLLKGIGILKVLELLLNRKL